YSYRPSDWMRNATPINPRAPSPAPAAGCPARSTSIDPSRNDTSLMIAYDVAALAPGVAVSWMALRPLKVACAIVTFFGRSRSAVCAAIGTTGVAQRAALIRVADEATRVVIEEFLTMSFQSPHTRQNRSPELLTVGHAHSSRSAMIGSIFIARRAGK